MTLTLNSITCTDERWGNFASVEFKVTEGNVTLTTSVKIKTVAKDPNAHTFDRIRDDGALIQIARQEVHRVIALLSEETASWAALSPEEEPPPSSC